jgi:hypothetical protein
VLGLEHDGLVARGGAMRGSGFVVPAAIAPLVAAATAAPIERSSWMLRAAGVAPEAFEAARAALLTAADQPRTARELRTRAGLDGVDTSRLLSYLALRGDLVALGAPSVTSNEGRYVAAPGADGGADGGATGSVTAPEPGVARAWLAGSYLRAFGPARVEDLAWWAGWPRTRAAEALAGHETVDAGGGRLLHAGDLAVYEAAPPLDAGPVLVPKWDAWTMGYPLDGRERFLDREVHDRVFDGDGNGLGMVLVAGRAAGAWVHRGVGRVMEADLDLFERPSAGLRDAIRDRLERMAGFLGYRALRTRDVPTVVPARRRMRRPLDA